MFSMTFFKNAVLHESSKFPLSIGVKLKKAHEKKTGSQVCPNNNGGAYDQMLLKAQDQTEENFHMSEVR